MMKVKDLFTREHVEDYDVYDDYTEELAIAYCGNKLTSKGVKRFSKALDLDVVSFDKDVAIIHVDNYDELRAVMELFHSAAGYCSIDDYERWFVD